MRSHSSTTAAHRRQFLRSAGCAAGGLVALASVSDRSRADHEAGARVSSDLVQSLDVELARRGADGPSFRKSIKGLPATELANLRRAFGILQRNGVYDQYVEIHASYCQHNILIWPWHRAYLYYFEKELQRAVPDADPPVTLPYWNYDNTSGDDSYRELPEPFRDPRVGGQTNPLYRRRAGSINQGSVIFDYPYVRTAAIIARYDEFYSFSNVLQNTVHNNVHNMMGRPMSDVLNSPSDPIFWLHHCNLDRVWVAWRAVGNHHDPTDASWLNAALPGFRNQHASDFLSPSALGYDYAVETFDLQAAGAAERRGKKYDLKAALRPARPGAEAEAHAAADLRRVTIRYTDIEVPTRESVVVRVFLGLPDANAETPSSDPHFVGQITLLPLGHAGARTSVELDATDVFRRLWERERRTDFEVTAVVIAPARADAAAAEGFRPRHSTLVIAH